MTDQKQTAPFRADVVGSYLRPAYLKQARINFSSGIIKPDVLKEIENRAIGELIQKQKAAGLQGITDGEFRRSSWHLDFMWAFNGVGHSRTETGIPFSGEDAMIDDTYLTGKVSVDAHPFVEHFKFVKSFEDDDTLARQTIPAPAQFLFQMIMPINRESTAKIYPDEEELIHDIAESYKSVMKQLYDAGCRNIQFDDCTWGVCIDPNALLIWDTDAEGLRKNITKLIRINNLALEGKPEDLTVNSHICRGNFHSTWATQGSYEPVAEELFGGENVNAFYLEFDDERSGGFEPLRFVSDEKKIVLGLVTTKSPMLEDKDAVIKRIHDAEKFIPLERLCLSPQCGFASTEEGNALTEDEQWRKIALVRDIASEVWK